MTQRPTRFWIFYVCFVFRFISPRLLPTINIQTRDSCRILKLHSDQKSQKSKLNKVTILEHVLHSCLSRERRRKQNNVTRERGERTTMQDECDPKYFFSIIVSHYSLHSRQWKRGISALDPILYWWQLTTSATWKLNSFLVVSLTDL